MKTKVFAVAALAVALAGCITDTRTSRDRGAIGLGENVPLYPAPKESRCTKYKENGTRGKQCAEATYLADIYVRKLSTTDEVCLENGFGDKPTTSCTCRAAVADVSVNKVLLEVREAKPDSKWFNKEQNQFWFEEGALVDLYLQDHGY